MQSLGTSPDPDSPSALGPAPLPSPPHPGLFPSEALPAGSRTLEPCLFLPQMKAPRSPPLPEGQAPLAGEPFTKNKTSLTAKRPAPEPPPIRADVASDTVAPFPAVEKPCVLSSSYSHCLKKREESVSPSFSERNEISPS